MEITSANYVISSATYKQCPAPDRPEYAFIGRSNVGKSSLINMLAGQRNLAKTSATPGKTQLINHFEVMSAKKKWYLVDLPGYGYATVSQRSRNNWENMIESYIRKRENLVCLFVLIDSRHEPQKADLEFIAKADKNKPGGTVRRVNLFIKTLLEQWETAPPHYVTSAVNKDGKEEILAYIDQLNRSFTKL